MILDDPKMNDEVAVSLRHLNRLARLLKHRRLEDGHVDSLLHLGSTRILRTVALVCID